MPHAFDTGFVCYYRGWHDLRREDMGTLWEHYVLNELFGKLQTRNLYYWRDKRHHEIDFVVDVRGGNPIAIECKWSASDFDAKNFHAFRRQYPIGDNFVVARTLTAITGGQKAMSLFDSSASTAS